jgi:thioredoxin-like negative regulator of GroEL
VDAELSQIKILLWVILGLQLLFVVSNILCRILGCGEQEKTSFRDLMDQGKIQEVLDLTKKRLETHPRDVDALYFRTKALIASGLTESARRHISQLMIAEPSLISVCKDWLEALDAEQAGDS